jgi:hypothetical protein
MLLKETNEMNQMNWQFLRSHASLFIAISIICASPWIMSYSFKLNSIWVESGKCYFAPQFAIRILDDGINKPVLELRVCHHYPGDLPNGILKFFVDSELVNAKDHMYIDFYSFSKWSPNRENHRLFTIPLTHYDPSKEINIYGNLTTARTRETIWGGTFVNGEWKDPEKK